MTTIRLPPARRRTPSGHDIPIPESVFLALADVQRTQSEQHQAMTAWQANHDSEHAELGQLVKRALANKRHDLVKIIGALGVAIPAIIGGVRVATPSPPAPVQVITPNALGNELEACATLPESNRLACQVAAAERDRLRRGHAP